MKNLEVKNGAASASEALYVHIFNGQLRADRKRRKEFSYIAKVKVKSNSMFSTIEQMNKHYEDLAIEAVEEEGLVREFFPTRFELNNEYLVSIHYRNHSVHQVGVDEYSVVSYERYLEMCNDSDFASVELLRKATGQEVGKYNFFKNNSNEFEL